jgi:ABC-2 type transport system ATP-binding protein
MIELDRLVKKFGDLVAVNDLSLKIERGEFFAMLGPNAAGKTTTIKLLTGLIKPTSGRARICGFDVQTQPLEARQRLAYVPDFPFLYDKLTAWEFFRFTGEMFRLDPARIKKNAQELVARFHLEEFADRTLEGLSHGTRQRIAIASALRSLAGTTVLVSTHQLSIAEEMADRIGIILGGKLIAVGTREELRTQSGASGALEEIFLSLTAESK